MEQKRTGLSYVFTLAKEERGKLSLGMLLAVFSSALSFVPYLVVYQILLLIIKQEVTLPAMLGWAGIGIAAAVLQAILTSFAGICSHTAAFNTICELDTMIFFREALEAHEFMLLPVMASAVVECRTADKELKTLNEDGEIGLARLFSIWANMMCAPGAATIVGCRPITMLSEILAQVHAYLTVHPLYDPEGLALYVELHHMMDAILMGDWFE